MIIEIVTFKNRPSLTRDEEYASALHAAHQWIKNPELVAKHFIRDDEGNGGAVYIWPSKEAAQRAHTQGATALSKKTSLALLNCAQGKCRRRAGSCSARFTKSLCTASSRLLSSSLTRPGLAYLATDVKLFQAPRFWTSSRVRMRWAQSWDAPPWRSRNRTMTT